MRIFEHSPLAEPKDKLREIRIATIRPGQADEDIIVTITRQELGHRDNHDDIPSEARWDALSYTWGREDQPRKNVYVEQTDGSGSQSKTDLLLFEVRENLYEALQNLRSSHDNRRVWIDALCIDQVESEQARKEKKWQIPIMHIIYRVSSKVVIWLGGAADDSDYALDFLQSLGEGFVFDWSTYAMQPTEKLTQATADLLNDWDRFTWNSREHNAVCALLRRNWFGRVFIKQEAFTASDESIISCGTVSIAMLQFRNAIQLLGVKGLDVRHPQHEENLARLTLVLSVFQRTQMSISNIMDMVRASDCKFPQDKVYGCLGMIKLATRNNFADGFPAEYPDTVVLYRDFFIRYYRFYQSIRLLQAAGLCQHSHLGGPSWMPDFTKTVALLDLSMECAVSHAVRADASFVGPDVLRVHGSMATTIARVDELKHVGDLSSDNLGAMYAELARAMRELIRPDSKEELKSFARAFGCPLLSLRIPMEEVYKRLGDVEILVEAVMRTGGLDGDVEIANTASLSNFQGCIRFYMQHRFRFMADDNGHIGVGPDCSRPGDVVTAVLGINNLVLLRPSIGIRFELVGACYMHGFNWGEAVLGPLPEGSTVVPRLREDTGFHAPYYFNEKTGENSFWDPRIDWHNLNLGEGEAAWTINAPPGNPQRKAPDTAYLREYHDAKIMTIDLI